MIMVSMCFQRKSKVHYHVAVIINYLGHCISLGALLLAFTLFMRLRSIRCLRNIIHWNLISAFILRNGTWFIVQLTMKPSVTESNQVWCRLVTAAYNYFHVTNFFWMFGEGCYLHTAVVLTYSTDKLRKWMFICIGWGRFTCLCLHLSDCVLVCPSVHLLGSPVRLSVCFQVFRFPSSWRGLLGSCTMTTRSESHRKCF
ncbi:Corticotropin-releasing factor receptor 1 [Xenoophorus captivus]|uniref:Corticotropin-releasing factor receptor 1 n=1 Tax=Xenoophorus captivus TaxID=1517983 RepID=A0ABV0QRM0_9TELE